jgi:hypothetical protein
MGGGIASGLEAAVQANRNNLSADLNSRITGQQIAARPGMLAQAANMTMGLENQLQSELSQAAMNRLNAANVGLQAYNAAQTNKRYQQQIDFEKQNARNQEMGLLLGKFGPDIAKGIKGLIDRGKPNAEAEGDVATPEPTFNGVDASGDWLGTSDSPMGIVPNDWLVKSGYTPKGDDAYIPKSGINYDPLHTINDVSIPPAAQPPFTGMYSRQTPNTPVDLRTESVLNGMHPLAQEGETYIGPNGERYLRQFGKWVRSYQSSPFNVGGPKPFKTF